MVLSTAFSQMFGIDYPIVSAPMDLIAGGELAAAVSGAGGLGLIGGGYGDRDWLARQFDLAAGAPVGCGFITWSLARQPQLLDLALQYEPVAVMLSFGDPAVFADAIKSAGTRLVCQIQNRTQAERALQVGADVLVAQGTEAGGHGHGPRSTLTLVPEIVDLVTARGTDIPVIAAGGIADGRGLAAALMLGAAGGIGRYALLRHGRSVIHTAGAGPAAGGHWRRHVPHHYLRSATALSLAARTHDERAKQRPHRPIRGHRTRHSPSRRSHGQILASRCCA